MNTRSIQRLPHDLIKEILKKLPVGEYSSLKGIARFGGTCKSHNIISTRLIFERFIELEPSIIYDIRTQHGRHLVAWEFYFLQFPERSWSIRTFKKIIKTHTSDFGLLFKYIASGLKNPNKEKVKAAGSVLRFILTKKSVITLLEKEFINYRDEIVQRLPLTLEDFCSTVSHANLCLYYILYRKLLTANSPSINYIIQKITTLINSPDYYSYTNTESSEYLLIILSIMFEQTLIDASLPSFRILAEKIEHCNSTSSNQFFLDLCKISQNLKNVVLPQYNIAVAKAVLNEGSRQHWQYKTNELVALLKDIIDLESSGDSNCCKLIMSDINYNLTRYCGETFTIFKDLQYYIYYKDSYLPISWENYRWWYLNR